MTDGRDDGHSGPASILGELCKLAAQIAGRAIRPDEGLMASGLTSEDLAVLLQRAAEQWGAPIPAEVLFERGDLTGLATYLADVLGVAPRPSGPAVSPGRALPGGTPAADERRALRGRIRLAAGHGRG